MSIIKRQLRLSLNKLWQWAADNEFSFSKTNTVCDKSVRSCRDGSLDRSLMVDTLSYFSFQPVLHDWCKKGCGMCYPVCGMMHIK